jgi:hypothetical protein
MEGVYESGESAAGSQRAVCEIGYREERLRRLRVRERAKEEDMWGLSCFLRAFPSTAQSCFCIPPATAREVHTLSPTPLSQLSIAHVLGRSTELGGRASAAR